MNVNIILYIGGTHFCDSLNHKRKIVRIDENDSKRDIDCLWANKDIKEKVKNV